VPDYIAQSGGQPISSVVSWVAVGFHHVPRDEDQSPMDLHWQGFMLMPRDLTAQRVAPPAGRESYNGQPSTWDGQPLSQIQDPGH
jgi:primary-amine oxidase